MKKCFLLALSLCFATIVNAQLSGTYTTGENINIFVQKNGTNFNFYNNLLVNTTNGYVFRFNNSTMRRSRRVGKWHQPASSSS